MPMVYFDTFNFYYQVKFYDRLGNKKGEVIVKSNSSSSSGLLDKSKEFT